jgi:hypothetical protein
MRQGLRTSKEYPACPQKNLYHKTNDIQYVRVNKTHDICEHLAQIKHTKRLQMLSILNSYCMMLLTVISIDTQFFIELILLVKV